MRQKTEPPPWTAIGISRATWYRLGKPEQKPPQRLTQTQRAREAQMPLRNLQRARRIAREAPDLAALVAAGTLKLGPAEQMLQVRAVMKAALAQEQTEATALKQHAATTKEAAIRLRARFNRSG